MINRASFVSFNVSVDSGNGAIVGDPVAAVGSLLKQAKEQLQVAILSGDADDSSVTVILRDANGNRVGHASILVERDVDTASREEF